jgi:hypothetical protein
MTEVNQTPVESTPELVESESQATEIIKNDLDDLINTSITDSAAKQKIDFTTTTSDADKKNEMKQARIREKKIPNKIIVFAVICVFLLAL